MKNTVKTSIALLFALFSLSANAAGDYAAGEKKAKEVCGACHGADGNSPSGTFPRLAGQWESYIVASLKQYKHGERKNAIMAPQAANLTDQDMADVAVFFSRQTSALHILPAN